MGHATATTYDKFPRQGSFLGRRVRICYEYDTSKCHEGVVVRDDSDYPGVMIIRRDDGRFILSTECQYQLIAK